MGSTVGHYEIAPHDPARDRALLDLWTGQAGLAAAEAQRRLAEILLTATTPEGELAGVTTAYLARNEQLGLEMWHVRVFVAPDHRRGAIALRLAVAGRDLLRDRFVSGADTRGPGIVFEVESPVLKERFTEAEWPRTGF